MKRLRLSAKLAMAIIPIGLVALIAAGFIAYTFLVNSEEQSETAAAATLSADAIDTLKAVWDEEGHAREVYVFGDDESVDDLASAIERTDDSVQELRDATSALQKVTGGFFGEVAFTLTDDVRKVTDALNQMRSLSSPTNSEMAGYHDVANALLAILPKTSSIISDRVQARDLFTAYYLAEGGQVSLEQEQLIEEFRADEAPDSSESEVSSARISLQSTLEVMEGEFGAWALRANQTANTRSAAILRYTRLPNVNIDTFPLRRNEDILNTSEDLAQGVADESLANATDSETEAYLVAGVAAIVLLLALWGAYVVIRSVVRRVRGVTDAAMSVSEEDLPALVEALQNPSQDIGDLKPTMIESAGQDEVGDLAHSFTLLHSTLIDVAGQQMGILRKGVSEIFVTLARRNRSLVDRQLALLDELESTEEDPGTLGGYYKLDHLATRMRRNAESLLVLAGSEPTRIWSNPLDVSEIIRAALGEVDDYQRVDIMALEPALVSGRAVADVAHLMSELLDNGTQFSSPVDRVRVAGLFDPDGYMLTVSDSGIGMTDERIAEVNRLLANPPVLGLALQPTLGMYVVARLAARHDIKVQVISASPGITVRVLMPKVLIEPVQPNELGAPEAPAAMSGSVDYRPAQPVLSNGARVVDAVAADDAPEEEDTNQTVLPGKVKGRHEHPRSRGAVAMPETQPPVVDPPERSPFASDEDAPQRPGALKRRVPGEALTLEQGEVTEPAHEASEVEPVSDEPVSVEAGPDLELSENREDELEKYQPTDDHEAGEPIEAEEVASADSEVTTEPTAEEEWVADRTTVGDGWRDVSPLPVDETADHEPEPSDAGDTVDAERPWWVEEESGKLQVPDSVEAESEVEAEADGVAEPVSHQDDVLEEAEADADAEADPKEKQSKITPVGLPVRTPGVSFRETDDSLTSSSQSTSGAIGIRSALTEFNDGRSLATQKLDEREQGDDEEGSDE